MACTLLCEMLCVCRTASLLLVCTHVDELNSFKIQLQTLCQTLQTVGVSEQNRVADAFHLCLYGSFHHCRVPTFCKDNTLRMHTGCVMQVACELCLLSQKLHQVILVSIPVGYGASCYSALNCRLCHGRADFGNEAWIDGFGDEVFWTEHQVIDTIHLVHDIRNRLLGKFGYCVHCRKLHFFVDGLCVYIECAAEYVWESDDIVYLVGIIASAC